MCCLFVGVVDMKYAIIPARGGSRRIPRKNIKEFHGRPIISYSIQAAQRSQLFDKVYVSTEDKEISDVASEYGASVLCRPDNLAVDEVGTQEIAAYHLRQLRDLPDLACVIYATCPLLKPADLAASCATLKREYVYCKGWFYWGKTYWFTEGKPLSQGVEYDVGERWIDINTPEDWAKAEEMYATLHKVAAA